MNRTITALAAVVLASATFMATASAQTAPASVPDLSGLWGQGIVPADVYRPFDPNATLINRNAGAPSERATRSGARNSDVVVAGEQDNALRKRGSINRPPYKPEFWDTIRQYDIYANAGNEYDQYADPVWRGSPLGVPRMGAPSKIIQTVTFVTLLYAGDNVFRDIPIDCRPHNAAMARDISYMGYAIGCWEGDTLVVTSKGFTDDTWLDWPGHIHSTEMEVIERFRRDGNRLFYSVTVIDPVMFTRPWDMGTQTLNLDVRPLAILAEDPPYEDRALGVLTYPTFRS